MPIFGKLLDASVNPRKVVAKREARASDYARYISLRDAKKPIDKLVLNNAKDFVALHTQLVEELPVFLEGYMRILDIAIVGFAKAQAAYHGSLRDRLALFLFQHIRAPHRRSSASNGLEVDEEPVDMSTGKGIIKAWHDSWSPYADAMEHFQCTRPGGFRSRGCMLKSQPVQSLLGSRASIPVKGGEQIADLGARCVHRP